MPPPPDPRISDGLLFSGEYFRAKQCRHGTLMYPKNDQFLGKSLEFYGEWCEGELKLLNEFIVPGDCIIDVGANIGTHTLAFATAAGPEGHVFAFEPQRMLFQMLTANIALNELFNVNTFQAAVATKQGHLRIPVLDWTERQNFGSLSVTGHDEGELVPVLTLDSLALERCDLLKIDVEGMEAQVVLGAKRTIARFRPTLYLENDRAEKSPALITLLQGLGYDVYWHFTSYFQPDNKFGTQVDLFPNLPPSINLLCQHPDNMRVQIGDQLPKASDPQEAWQSALSRWQA